MNLQDISTADASSRPSEAPHGLRPQAAAAQVQALRDAKKQTEEGAEARTWLLEPNEDFEFWCQALGYRADEGRRHFLKTFC